MLIIIILRYCWCYVFFETIFKVLIQDLFAIALIIDLSDSLLKLWLKSLYLFNIPNSYRFFIVYNNVIWYLLIMMLMLAALWLYINYAVFVIIIEILLFSCEHIPMSTATAAASYLLICLIWHLYSSSSIIVSAAHTGTLISVRSLYLTSWIRILL